MSSVSSSASQLEEGRYSIEIEVALVSSFPSILVDYIENLDKEKKLRKVQKEGYIILSKYTLRKQKL